MTCTILITILAAFTAVAHGAPDWTAILGKVNQIESAVQAPVRQVNTIAKKDNAAVGADIERKLVAKAIEARAVLHQFHAAINERSLTEAQAKVHSEHLKYIHAIDDIRADVAKLSAPVQAQIRDIFSNNLAEAERLENEIYALLRQ